MFTVRLFVSDSSSEPVVSHADACTRTLTQALGLAGLSAQVWPVSHGAVRHETAPPEMVLRALNQGKVRSRSVPQQGSPDRFGAEGLRDRRLL